MSLWYKHYLEQFLNTKRIIWNIFLLESQTQAETYLFINRVGNYYLSLAHLPSWFMESCVNLQGMLSSLKVWEKPAYKNLVSLAQLSLIGLLLARHDLVKFCDGRAEINLINFLVCHLYLLFLEYFKQSFVYTE